uniref:IRG-type G domain-containing protein n=1 Tax=Alexandrium monilatum TaxID=311494 RepID=A0A7S4SZ33_9DINO
MAGELADALQQRQSVVDDGAEVWESRPAPSFADAKHFEGVSFGAAPSAQEWMAKLGSVVEEDPLQDAFAQLLKSHGSRPLPVRRREAKEEELRGLTRALGELQEQLRAKSGDLGSLREELARREADLARREESLKADVEDASREARRNYPQPEWLGNVEGTLNVAVVGNSGVGKSLLINRLRRLQRQSRDWAEVGVKETTKAPTRYALPGDGRVRLWDLPGAGTESFPAEAYIQAMGLRYFDSVLIVTAVRFTSTEIELRAELLKHHVPFLMVRTKVDIDVWNNHQDNGMAPDMTLRQIRNEFRALHGVEDLYLVSARDPELYDMPRLRFDAFPGLKSHLDTESLVFSPHGQGGWSSAWALPSAHSELLAGIQGYWRDLQDGTRYIVDGRQAHVTLLDGRAAVVCLQERDAEVWWCKRWSINMESVAKARCSGVLRWTPADLKLRPLVWRWTG